MKNSTKLKILYKSLTIYEDPALPLDFVSCSTTTITTKETTQQINPELFLDQENLHYKKSDFDYIKNHIIQHTEDPVKTIEELTRDLKPGGTLELRVVQPFDKYQEIRPTLDPASKNTKQRPSSKNRHLLTTPLEKCENVLWHFLQYSYPFNYIIPHNTLLLQKSARIEKILQKYNTGTTERFYQTVKRTEFEYWIVKMQKKGEGATTEEYARKQLLPK